jgi:hypothetical protein
MRSVGGEAINGRELRNRSFAFSSSTQGESAPTWFALSASSTNRRWREIVERDSACQESIDKQAAAATALVPPATWRQISGVVMVRRAKTTVDPTKHRASRLVPWGVYAFSRNRMYSGGLVMLCGWPVILSNVLTVLFLPVYFLYISRFQVEPEERALASLFGTMCVAYQGRAGRWL